MTRQYEKLRDILKEVFQLDQADLDFGIYRIMNQKRDEINDFLENRLLKQIEEILSTSGSTDSAAIQKEIDTLITNAKEMGVPNPESLPKVDELRSKLKAAGNQQELANEVFSHLASFFRRYYDKGDFISQRRYKKDVYAIPYEGEEVKLYWANHDQYYIKSSEYFRNYTFKLDKGKKVAFFALREASTEQNNNKAQDKNRLFRLADEDFLETTEDEKELKLWFHYEPMDKKYKQEDLIKEAVKRIAEKLPEGFKGEMLKPSPTPKNEKRTFLEKHLVNYTARNTFDYFIHKDLGGFLSRELDFYIKNEILHIDDINLDQPQSFDKQLKVIKSFKGVSQKIIAFLAQLENFQKKLWLKKKMIVQCDYCITLDRVPEELYEKIAANEEQRKEWVSLFAIDEIKPDLHNPGYSEPLSTDFLKANPFLVLDTKFFSRELKYQLLGSIHDIDDQCDGLLINSENFQALNFLHAKYRENVKCVYIDPPYNTDQDDFAYKDSFKHSSWITMMSNRTSILRSLMMNRSIFYCSIDRDENFNLLPLLFQIFGEENFLEEIVWQKAYGGGGKTTHINNLHEYIIGFGLDKESIPRLFMPPDPKMLKYYKYSDNKFQLRGKYRPQPLYTNSNDDRQNLTYPLPIPKEDLFGKKSWDSEFKKIREALKNEEIDVLWDDDNNSWIIKYFQDGVEKDWPNSMIYPPKQWQWGWSRTKQAIIEDELVFEKKGDWVVNYKQYRFDENGEERGKKPGSVFIGPYTQSGTDEVRNIFGFEAAKFPKPSELIKNIVSIDYSAQNQVIIDCFAGSGTTGHAIIDLNREIEGSRKYILVEMGEYFDSVTKPRMQKVIYSEDWKNGKPVSRKGSSHCFKYFALESYEDALNNLELNRSQPQVDLLTNDKFSEEYLLNYMLDVEAKDSLLKLEAFKKPFGYKLKITENNELKEQEVDLVETFNYLIGLVIESQQLIKNTMVVQGRNLEGDKILIIWRDVEQMDNKALNEFFSKLQINTKDSEFKRIYVNGDNHLENMRTEEEQWKVVLIEEEFKKRMFEETDV